MNLKDRCMEFVLAAFDRLMDKLTGGLWEWVRGEVTWHVMKINRPGE